MARSLRSVCRNAARAFTIIELLAAVAIFSVILVVIFGVTQQTGNAWRSTTSKIDAFQGARAAFESLTQTLGQATLNTYYDYYDAAGARRTVANASSFIPASYGRYSDLHFVAGKSLLGSDQISHAVFFQTPAGYSDQADFQDMETLLNATGYYVIHSADSSLPAFLDSVPNKPKQRFRYRLVEFLQPSQQLEVYAGTTGMDWFKTPLANDMVRPLQIAENVIALVVLPKRPARDSASALPPEFEYDSRAGSSKPQALTQHQLPPLVEVIMVAIDEPSAKRLESENGSSAPDLGVSTLFRDAADLEDDLQDLEDSLNAKRITYRIFRTTVALRNAKWSS